MSEPGNSAKCLATSSAQICAQIFHDLCSNHRDFEERLKTTVVTGGPGPKESPAKAARRGAVI